MVVVYEILASSAGSFFDVRFLVRQTGSLHLFTDCHYDQSIIRLRCFNLRFDLISWQRTFDEFYF